MKLIAITKFNLGDKVRFMSALPNKLDGFEGWICAVRPCFDSEKDCTGYKINYCVDPSPGFEHDDEEFISEVNLIKI